MISKFKSNCTSLSFLKTRKNLIDFLRKASNSFEGGFFSPPNHYFEENMTFYHCFINLIAIAMSACTLSLTNVSSNGRSEDLLIRHKALAMTWMLSAEVPLCRLNPKPRCVCFIPGACGSEEVCGAHHKEADNKLPKKVKKK